MSVESAASECQVFRDATSDFLDGHVTDQERADLEAHLGSCSSCDEFVDGIRMTLSLLSELCERSAASEEEAGATHFFDEYFPEPDLPVDLSDWTLVKEAWGDLAGLPRNRRALAIREGGKYLDPHLCDWLVARSRRASSVNPDSAVPLAEAAVEVARQLDLKCGDPRRLGRALEALAGCLVLLREFAPASSVLQELGNLCGAADADSEEKAQYLSTKGLYYSLTGQFEESLVCLDQALEIRRRHENRRSVICGLVNLAGAVLSTGDSCRALRLYGEAEDLLQAEKDPPRLQLAVYSNLVLALCEARETDQARAVLPKVNDLAATVGGWYSGAYATWLRGTLLWAEQRLEESSEIFERVRSKFYAHGHLVCYVEASLDLARIYLQRGRLADLNALASELLVKTQEVGSNDRVRAAVVSFGQAVRQRSLSSQAISSIAVALNSVKMSQRL